jgi:hypothetical protein
VTHRHRLVGHWQQQQQQQQLPADVADTLGPKNGSACICWYKAETYKFGG